MEWTCPACGSRISQSDVEPKPRRGVIYRCHVCRLELMLNEATNRLQLTPLPEPASTTIKKPRR